MTTPTRASVLAAVAAGATTKAEIAAALDVPQFNPALTLVLFHLTNDKVLSVHADGQIRRYAIAPE